MKVILIKDVDKFGKAGEVKEASDGYARNFLLRSGSAILAGSQALKDLEARKKKEKLSEDKHHKKIEKTASGLQGLRLVIKAKAGENGKLYGSVGSKEITNAINKAANSEIKINNIILDQSIKKTGEKEVIVDLGSNMKARIKIVVEPI